MQLATGDPVANPEYPFDEAMMIFGDPELVARLNALTPETDRMVEPDGTVILGTVSWSLKQKICVSVVERLKAGELIASHRMITRPGTYGRADFEVEWWRNADIGFDEWYNLYEIDGPEFTQVRVRLAPSTVENLSERLAPPELLPEHSMPSISRINFKHSGTYELIEVCGKRHKIGERQAGVIRKLHEASQTEQPWVHIKELLPPDEGTNKISQLFKKKPVRELLMLSDQQGYYRLNID